MGPFDHTDCVIAALRLLAEKDAEIAKLRSEINRLRGSAAPAEAAAAGWRPVCHG